MTALRSYFFTLALFTITPVVAIILLPALFMKRGAAVAISRFWARCVLGALRLICGIRYEVRGVENIPGSPVLIASKHQAMWETVALLVLLRDPAVVLKKELLAVPFYGWYCRKMEMIGVDRAAHAKAMRAMIGDARKALGKGRPIMIFPEGTRTAPGTGGDYKPGVAALYRQLDVPCVPVALNSGLYWRRHKPKRTGTVIIEFLPAIEAGLSRRDFQHQLAERIEPASLALYKEGCAAVGEPVDVPDTEPPHQTPNLSEQRS